MTVVFDNLKDTATLPRSEYDELVEKARWADALDAAGVDNWDGCDHAQEIMREGQS